MAGDEAVKLSDLKKEKQVDFKNLPDKEKLFYYLAERTDGYVGADMENLVREAAMLSLRENINAKEVKKKHFDAAINKVRASIGKGDVEKYKKIEENYLRSAKSAIGTECVNYLG